MAKKQFFCIVDTETTINDHVFDFGAIICDRQGRIYNQAAIIINEFKGEELFHDINDKGFWAKERLTVRHNNYLKMVESGSRMVASVNAINRWLEKAVGKYNPILTAYNLAFDSDKCQKSGIDLNMFKDRFCLWHMACGHFASTKAYRQFIMDNHYIGNRTELGNMVYKTNAEVMTHFITGENNPEPHTAIEDAIGWELPILKAIVNKTKWREKNKPFSWRDYQARNAFVAK